MIDSSKKVAHAVGGKTARACDSCIKKRARVYCAADDAFLCKACDSSVHSANQLAGRHERVRLKTASLKPSKDEFAASISAVPSWHRGFTRKARTPRHAKSVNSDHKSQEAVRNPFPVVPEVGADDTSFEENEEHDHQLLYRVPIFDPVVAELLCTCSANNSNDQEEAEAKNTSTSSVVSMLPNYGTNTTHDDGGMNYSSSNGFLPSDMDLAEFAADVDSLLGRGLDDNERLGMEGLGLMDCGKEKECGRVVKLEQENEVTEGAIFMDACQAETEIDMIRESFVFNFEDYQEEEEIKVGVAEMNIHSNGEHDCEVEEDAKSTKKRNIFLRLDYDAVITAWDTQASPWTSALRPDFDSIFFPDCMGAELHYPFGDLNGVGVHSAVGDGGREARVSRYREKRRTRLFSKKIRYEVRKLNAEKRPRMKGRFVKRSSFAGSSANFPMLAK